MIRKLIPMLLVIFGLVGGVAAGFFLRPTTAPATEASPEHAPAEIDPALQPEFVKLSNQFIVPIVEKGRVTALVILAVNLEVKAGTTATVFTWEPKLRDAFLQVLFDHANAGGFNGAFTQGANLNYLRKALLEVAQKTLPDVIDDVLIADIARQDS